MNTVLTDQDIARQSDVGARTTEADGVGTQGAFDDAPLFSIILTTYNRREFLKGALQSLKEQTMQDFEVVVVNDCGVPVEDITTGFDLNISYIRRGQNGGPSAAMNTALQLCRGRYVGFLGDDDIVLPQHLAVHVQTHAEHPGSVVYTDARCLTLSGNGVPPIVTNWPSEDGYSKEKLFVRNFIMQNNWTLPRTMFAEIGCFDETLPALVDWDVLLRLASQFPFVHVSECTAEVRFHGGRTGRLSARRTRDYPGLYRQLYARYDDFGSEAVREGRRDFLAQIDAGVGSALVEDYQTVAAKLRLDESSEAFRERVAILTAATSACVVVVDTGHDEQATERTLRSVDEQCFVSRCTLVSSRITEADGQSAHEKAAIDAAVEGAGADWVVCVPAGDTLDRYALLLLAERFVNSPDMACCYVDEDNSASGNPDGPIFKPDFNLDLLRSYPYTGSCLAVRSRAWIEQGGLHGDFGALAHIDLLFRCVERYGMQNIGHVAEVLHRAATTYPLWLSSSLVVTESPRVVSAHLQRLEIAHEVQPGGAAGVNQVRYLNDRQPPVSIIIPTSDQLAGLNGIVDSLLATTDYKNYELLIVDYGSRDPATCAYLNGLEGLNNPQLRVLRWEHPFNQSAICNFAATEARGEYLVLLGDDKAVVQRDWLDALLNHAQRPEVGIVGAKLHDAKGSVQNAGVVLGLQGPSGKPFVGEPMDAPGYMQRLQVDQNYTALTAACLMIRKAAWDEVGGMDEAELGGGYGDIDLCLKVRAAGYLAVWTPYARLLQERGTGPTSIDVAGLQHTREQVMEAQEAMYRKWLPLLAADPAYNHNLGLGAGGFDLQQGRDIAWQPFENALLPRMFCIAADVMGCGHYRVRQPLLAMQREGVADGILASSHQTPVLLERFAPSSIVMQRQITPGQIAAMRSYQDFSQAFKVYELDDYLPNLPLKSAHRGQMPKDVVKSLRKALSLVDRFVVSTEPLAEQLANMHDDIRVVVNRLPTSWWGKLPVSQRREAAKPRVGWAGGSGHRGDLELIVDVVRDLADEVEWVFFGLCPEALKPFVHEVHAGVPIEEYPAALAGLNLDLALAPVEDNVFNSCKSNLRLLEYGVCGFPVVCSDIVCYRGDLPVTRVRNRYKDWVDAIRMHVSDLDATAKAGDALREVVRRDWMLTGDNLVAWRNAWLPDA